MVALAATNFQIFKLWLWITTNVNEMLLVAGTFPSTLNEIVDAQACVTGIFADCPSTVDIQIQNCGDYNLYYLVPTPSCPEAYCFGKITAYKIFDIISSYTD